MPNSITLETSDPGYSSLKEWLTTDRSIAYMLTGSRAYGTAIETSDYDFRGVFIAPKTHYFGVTASPTHYTLKPDFQFWEVRKYVEQLLRSSPQFMETLWLPSECYVSTHSAFDQFITMREEFITQKTKRVYWEVAKSHFSYVRRRKLSAEKESATVIPEGTLTTRKRLEREVGYDCVGAYHSLRFLYQGFQAVNQQILVVDRRDSCDDTFFLDVRTGKYSWDSITAFYEAGLEQLVGATTSHLPEEPPTEKAEQFLVQTVDSFLQNRGY